MEFFRKLSEICGGATNITLKILEKNGEMTIQVLPEGTANLRPLIATGSPAELDVEFLPSISEPLKRATGVLLNIEGFEKDLADIENEKQKAVDSAKSAKTATAPATPSKSVPKTTEKKQEKKKNTTAAQGFAFSEEDGEEEDDTEGSQIEGEEETPGEIIDNETETLTEKTEEDGDKNN
jgi:PRTRC genetic system protein E